MPYLTDLLGIRVVARHHNLLSRNILNLLADASYVPQVDTRDPSRLLCFREDFRRVIHNERPLALLAAIIRDTDSKAVRRITIWLLGRCRSTKGTKSVAAWAADPDRKIRREVVRALQRMHAWSELRKIASVETDPAIARMARQRIAPKYAERLRGFLGNVTAQDVPPSRQTLVMTDQCDLTAGRPPKPRWVIRYILERIQYWVRRHRA